VPPRKKPRVIDLREVEQKIAEYKEHVSHDRRYRTVVKELEQARHALRKGFDRLLAAVSKRTKKRPAKKVAARKKAARKKPSARKKPAARKRRTG
jgi:hypothetical protein